MDLIDRVKERTGTNLPDAELLAMLDGIAADLDARLGPAGPIDVHSGDLGDADSRFRTTIRLQRPIDLRQPLTVIEIEPGNSGAAANRTELAVDDFLILHGGRTLLRVIDGTNGRAYWAPLVRISYTPAGEQAARDEATIKLMQLDLSYRGGLKSERAGDYQFTLGGDPAAEREAIIQGLAARQGMVMA